jgi:hypothetical protein
MKKPKSHSPPVAPISPGDGQHTAQFGTGIAEAVGEEIKVPFETGTSADVGESTKDRYAAESLAMLIQGLQNAYQLPGKDGTLDPAVEMRLRHIHALMWLAQFFKKSGKGNDVANRFADLATALWGLKDGVVHPVLAANRSRGRSADRSDIWTLRILAANGLECLLRSNVYSSQQEASAAAAKEYPELKKLMRPKGDAGVNKRKKITLASSLRSWRNAVARGKVKDSVANGFAQEFLAFIAVFAEISSSQQLVDFGRKYLKSASDQAAKLL